MPASVFATASPRSSWQWTDSVTSASSGHRRRTSSRKARVLVRERVADGVGKVDRRRARLDRGSAHLCDERRDPSASRPRMRTRPRRPAGATCETAKRACSTTSGGSRPSLCSMWIGLVARKTWTRVRPRAPASASTAASRSSARVRASEATVGLLTAAADGANALEVTRRGDREAGLDHVDAEALEPERDLAFSSGESAMPGDCSPSLSVVSKIVILRRSATFCSSCRVARRRTCGVLRWTCAPARRVGRVSP